MNLDVRLTKMGELVACSIQSKAQTLTKTPIDPLDSPSDRAERLADGLRDLAEYAARQHMMMRQFAVKHRDVGRY